MSDSQRAIIEPLFPRAGNRSKWEKRELVDAVLYFVDNGCKWRNLPIEVKPDTPVITTLLAPLAQWDNNEVAVFVPASYNTHMTIIRVKYQVAG